MSIERFEHHPYFTSTLDPIQGKSRVSTAVSDARPAFSRFYDGCVEAYTNRSNAQLAIIDFFHSLPDQAAIDSESELMMQQHAANARLHSTVSERYASALLQQSAELIESLLFELTNSTKARGAGLVINGVAFDEALQACGNYTRHKAE